MGGDSHTNSSITGARGNENVNQPVSAIPPEPDAITQARRFLEGTDATSDEIAFLNKMLEQYPAILDDYLIIDNDKILDALRETISTQSRNSDLIVSNPSLRENVPFRTAQEIRKKLPGQVSGGENLPVVTEMLPDGRVGFIPGQIAEKLRGRNFNSFDEFRSAFWQEIAHDPNLRDEWNYSNLERMRQGYAPKVDDINQIIGSRDVYELDHSHDLQFGGDPFDLDSIRIVTPKFHQKYGDTSQGSNGVFQFYTDNIEDN